MDVGYEGGIGQEITDEFDAAGVMLGAIPAMHGGEHAVRSGLQRHMEMWGDPMVRSEEVDEILGDIERLNRADAQALDRSFIEGTAKQIEEFDLRREVATLGGGVDATEKDRAEPGSAAACNFREDGFVGQALGLSARE